MRITYQNWSHVDMFVAFPSRRWSHSAPAGGKMSGSRYGAAANDGSLVRDDRVGTTFRVANINLGKVGFMGSQSVRWSARPL